MADVQKYFERFHEVIRVDYDMADELREKRDIIIKRINKYLQDRDLPQPRVLLQGSYKMKTGTKPIADLEYDIDIGLRFDFREDEHPAAQVRKWVYDAVKDHTSHVEDKGPCIRVLYEKGFHLDLVVYAVWEVGGVEQHRLAHKTNGWRPTDPPALLDYVDRFRDNFKETEDSATKTDQFRRCVRCIRRWNDVCLPFEDEGKACGLAFVLLAIQRGLSRAMFVDGRADDRTALERFVHAIVQTPGRLEARKPTPEYEDVFGRISHSEMSKLKERFGTLGDRLEEAGRTSDPVRACELLREVFGGDFPVPEHAEVATKSKAPAILTSSRSA